jgi:hypothetical protein
LMKPGLAGNRFARMGCFIHWASFKRGSLERCVTRFVVDWRGKDAASRAPLK